MILCLGTTPAVQRVMIFRKLTLDTVNRATQTYEGAAGKSINVAKVLQALGEKPVATGFLGGDRGEYIASVLAAKGVEQEFVSVGLRTRECITIIDESAGAHTELVEESGPISNADYDLLFAIVRRRLSQACRAMIMSGSLTTGGPPDLYFQCAQLAHAAGVLPIVDAQGPPLTEALIARPSLVKPNRVELGATVGRDLTDDHGVMLAMREICERGAQRVVVTAGSRPTIAFDGKSFWRIIAPQVKVVNPIGSGDAFTAALVWRLLRGDDLGEAGRWGSASGTANALTMLPGEIVKAECERLAKEVIVDRLPTP